MTSLKDCIKKREVVQSRVISIQMKINAFTAATVHSWQLELAASELKEIKDKFENLYELSLLACTSEVDIQIQKDDFETCFSSVENLRGKVMVLQRTTPSTATKSPSFKLDRIKLPQFRGDFHEWPTFRDLFISAVHANNSLAGAEKIIYLKSCLTGEAATIISSFQTTAACYDLAWAAVLARYDHKREIIFAHLKRFDDFKPLQLESPTGLRGVSDSISECVRALSVLGVPVEHWDLILIFHGLKKLDPESRKQWSLDQDTEVPTLKEFCKFLEDRSRALLAADPATVKHVGKSNLKISSSNHVTHGGPSSAGSMQRVPITRSCPKCSESHPLYMCQMFTNLSISDRNSFVSSKHLCFNCFTKGHGTQKCGSKFSCRKCGGRHHTLLHRETQAPTTVTTTSTPSNMKEAKPSSSTEPSVSSGHCVPNEVTSNVVLLGTLVVTANDSQGQKHNCRVFVDPGSEAHFISEHCVDMLNLPRSKTCVSIRGIGGVQGKSATGIVSINLFSRFRDYQLAISALVLPKVTNPLPRIPCQSAWPHLKGVELSDPQFFLPGPVDILLGAKVAASLMLPGIIQGPVGSPIAQNTVFGWMLSGEVKTEGYSSQLLSHHVSCGTQGQCIDFNLEKFWVLEEPEFQEIPRSLEQHECEKQFIQTHQRDKNGRYSVLLPFKSNTPKLGNSRNAAVNRFLKIERSLSCDPQRKAYYVKAMRESLNSGFMELVPPEDLMKSDSTCYYLPHHVVVKESSTTTKHRVVFDASSKTDSGLSLNDVLMTGPKLQVDLLPLIIRFRSHLVAMSADIEKFYPQFLIAPEHTDFQRLVWRESTQEPLLDYKMMRVTFGVTSAPYLAIRCLHQLAEDEKKDFPLASTALKEEFLVDNLLSGSHDVESALILQKQILGVMGRGQLTLRQWMSNSVDFLQDIPQELRDPGVSLIIEDNGPVKTIGLLWHPSSDTFGITIVTPNLAEDFTKRKILSALARTFDPLGWLSPVTIRAKLLMQELWKAKVDWDTDLPHQFQQQWSTYCNELKLLEEFRVNRCIVRPLTGSTHPLKYELHGFSDASKTAYSACVYLRTLVTDYGNSAVALVTAKTKVAPVKSETIPRLELCACLLLANLLKTVRQSLTIPFQHIRCWTDSTIALGWINSQQPLPVFQSNRVRLINEIIPAKNWSHVAGDENPADCASRGISSSALLNHPLWLKGPPWLATASFPPEVSTEVNTASVTCPELSSVSRFVSNCSSFSRMKRVIAYCLRFGANSRPKMKRNKTGQLSVDDLSQALNCIVRIVQAESFQKQLKQCKRNLPLDSTVKYLAPFFDELGILRVGGRLQQSNLPFEKKHPILLPSGHNFTYQLVSYSHRIHLHAGPQLLLALVREQFWIVGGPKLIKRIVSRCVVCHRHSPATSNQIMGQLPPSRITPSRPFSSTGMDYAGPYHLCMRPGRKPTILKTYICVFVCMATKAIHLEHSNDLSTPSFMAALTRFISRRGLPSDLYSDGGLNFVGAANEIRDVQRLLQSQAHISAFGGFLAEQGITFHFNPPFSPHHGGLWEAAVKSMKFHLRRIIGDRHLSVEEFLTLLAQVEAALNSRPLTQMSTDPNDFSALTPGHFLVGDSLKALPQKNTTEIKIGRLSRWESTQHIFQHFWRRWNSEYLSLLNSRPKWFTPQPDLKVGVLVLVRDDDAAWGPLKWKLGRIVNTFPGPDGRTRVCDVKTSNGRVFRRPIVKLSPLPIYN